MQIALVRGEFTRILDAADIERTTGFGAGPDVCVPLAKDLDVPEADGILLAHDHESGEHTAAGQGVGGPALRGAQDEKDPLVPREGMSTVEVALESLQRCFGLPSLRPPYIGAGRHRATGEQERESHTKAGQSHHGARKPLSTRHA